MKYLSKYQTDTLWNKIRRVKIDVPVGKSGDWSITKDRHTTLKYFNSVVMQNSKCEMMDCWEFLHVIGKRVLISGLGIGWTIEAAFATENVNCITVIEKSEDVINLVWNHYHVKFGNKLHLIHADVLKWQPPKKSTYDTVWHDIWNKVSIDNLPEMKLLCHRYEKLCDWQGYWGYSDCLALVKKEI